MPIEITGKPVSNIHPLASGTVSSINTPINVPHDTARPAADSIKLTDTAAYLRKLENTLSALPVVDMQRTESIKKALAEGSFIIDPVRVADKLLDFESMLYYRAA